MPPEEEKKDDLEAVIESEPELEEPSGVTVDMDKPEEKKEEKPKAEPKQEKRPEFDERKLHNAVGFQVRQQMKAVKDELLAEIRALREAGKPTESKEDELDEVDKLAQKDWKAAVRKLADEQAELKLQARIKEQQDMETSRLKTQLVERSKSFVLSQYPQLADESSDEHKVFIQVWNENPSLWTNPEGHRLAMYDMEERMRASGKTPKRVKQEVDKEVRRQLRASASSIVGRQANSNGKYVLTKEQQMIADQLGIKYEDYAKTASALENKEDISI